MSDTALKFGPEWLRALSHGNSVASPPPSPGLPKYKLAEYRYGREEMLALYDKNVSPPEELVGFGMLFQEKLQIPLALTQMTDEEGRLWNRSVNSDAVLRLMGRGTAPPAARGRGGSVDRGRGRGRGGYYTRGLSFDEDLEPRREGPAGDFPRGPPRNFERSQSERGWPERNGGEEWNGTVSPRKEYNRASVENWRSRGDDEGWRMTGRPEKLGRGSWRSERVSGGDAGGFDREHERGALDHDDHGGSRRWDDDPRRSRSWSDNPHRWRSSEDSDVLPEWATENPGESGGSFDASGAFHGGAWSGDEEDGSRDGHTQCERPIRKSKSASRVERSDHPRPQSESPPKETVSSADISDSVHTSPNKTYDPVTEPGREVQTADCKSTSREMEQDCTEITDASYVTLRDDRGAESWEEDWETEIESGQNVNKVVESDTPVNNDITESSVQFDTQPVQNCETITNTPEPEQPVPDSVKVTRPVITSDSRQKSEEENMEHMKAVADNVVAKLIEDEHEQEEHEAKPPMTSASTEKWYYRDPQGEIQGPFLASEMSDWYSAGYFTMNLLVRRVCDDRFSQLGDIIKLWGRVPFNPGPTPPPLKSADPSPPPEQEKLLLLQQQLVQQQLIQQQILQQQLFLRQQAAVVSKISQLDGWNSLTPQQQQQVLSQYVVSQPVDPLLQQVRIQLEQQRKLQAGMLQPKDSMQALLAELQQPKTTSTSETLLSGQQLKGDPVQSLLQQLQTINPEIAKVDADPIQTLMQQITKQVNGPLPSQPQADSLWGSGTNTLPSAAPWPPHPSPHIPPPPHLIHPIQTTTDLPSSVWDIDSKEEELKRQQQQLEMRRREEDRRKREEELRQQEEKQQRKLEEQRLEEEERRMQEERRRQEEYRKQEEKRREEEERNRLEELRRQEEERKRLEEERERKTKEEQIRQEELRRKAEEEAERKRLEELRCEEEKQKRLEEERHKREEELQRKAEEERSRQEEEKKRLEELQKEEEERRRQEEEQKRRKEEQSRLEHRQQQEALWKLQEQQKAKAIMSPWNNHNSSPAETHSFTEIQKHQEEKERKERQFQQQLREQEQREMQAQQKQSSQMVLKWATQNMSLAGAAVKSLAEIQAEEAKSLAKKQEKERSEKQVQQGHMSFATASVWGSAAQNLSWAPVSRSNSQRPNGMSTTSKQNSVWGDTPAQNVWGVSTTPIQNTNAGGFWDDTIEPLKKAKTVKKEKGPMKIGSLMNSSKVLKNRSKKDEETVMKLFEPPADDFTLWCCKSLAGLQVSVDVPTFISFLKDVESPYEVHDYVRSYLGESKEMQEFAKQFLERRSKWRNSQKSDTSEDNMCVPARAINPQQNDFHEVKTKGKKGKKGKMQKMDSSVLGFNVTAAPDRINAGERDFSEM